MSPLVVALRHCEEERRSNPVNQLVSGLPRFARNDGRGENSNSTYAEGHGGGIFAKHKLRIRMHSKRVFLLSRHLYD